ncbi:hypothetical protein PCANC_07210 [Puccinia coronata f. sp. avenae]|uniref:Integrase catalytic domain-containing protein n=1 Tax=Puccinia coronata f. sp. avenae TaxID=200324 RepID=A0A2N5VU21_9BASI|nr:hypothetical protein PCANC_07210 [Puccinia coronata f. sp. avenae]
MTGNYVGNLPSLDCTRFCAAIPIKLKSDVAGVIAFLIDIEAKRFGYYPTTIHLDRGSEFINSTLKEFCASHLIKQRVSDPYTPQQNGLAERFNRTILESMRTILEDSGVDKRFWNEVAKVSFLTLNQIPAHRSKKSPFELFKGRTLPLDYFWPIGNRVSYVILPEQSFSKLQPKVVETKNVQFLDYTPSANKPSNWDISVDESPILNEEEGASEPTASSESSSSNSDEEVILALVPDSQSTPTPDPIIESTRVLRDRTAQVKLVKYTYLTAEPKSFIVAMNSKEKERWKKAADEELSNIKHHEVWEDFSEIPDSFLRTT